MTKKQGTIIIILLSIILLVFTYPVIKEKTTEIKYKIRKELKEERKNLDDRHKRIEVIKKQKDAL